MRFVVILLSVLFGAGLLWLVRRIRGGPATEKPSEPAPRSATFSLPGRFPPAAPDAVYPVEEPQRLPGREVLLAVCEQLQRKGWKVKGLLGDSGYVWSVRVEHGRFGGDLSLALLGAGEGVTVAAAGTTWFVRFWDRDRERPAPGLLLTDVADALDGLGAAGVAWARV